MSKKCPNGPETVGRPKIRLISIASPVNTPSASKRRLAFSNDYLRRRLTKIRL